MIARHAILIAVTISLTQVGWLPSANAASPVPQVKEIFHLLRAWQIVEAENKLKPLAKTFPKEPAVELLRGVIQFMHGDYPAAVKIFDKLEKDRVRTSVLRYYSSMAKAALKAVKNFKSVKSPAGHFIIRYKPGVDEVLIPYAGKALDSAYRELGKLFKYYPKRPVVVEIYGSTAELAKVTPLRLSEIQTSGTIAICKYNRLMVVSPRALLWGYDWLDTLAHEYVHYLVTKKTRNRVPIWLHEGLAKFFENRWRERSSATLSTIHEHLLAEAIASKKLISFARMSPSMAKLPSQADTTLAFAEVFTVVQQMYEKGGMALVRRMLDAMTSGLKDKEAIKKVLGLSFGKYYQEWKRYVAAQRYRRHPGLVTVLRLFKGKNRKNDELKQISEKKARRFVYLGDLLRARRRFKAAVKEYRKAVRLVGDTQPMIQSKLARALLAMRQIDKAIDALRVVERYYPRYFLINFYLGQANLAKRDHARARRFLERALTINPFDVEVHRMLSKIYQKLGQNAKARLAATQIKILSRQQGAP